MKIESRLILGVLIVPSENWLFLANWSVVGDDLSCFSTLGTTHTQASGHHFRSGELLEVSRTVTFSFTASDCISAAFSSKSRLQAIKDWRKFKLMLFEK